MADRTARSSDYSPIAWKVPLAPVSTDRPPRKRFVSVLDPPDGTGGRGGPDMVDSPQWSALAYTPSPRVGLRILIGPLVSAKGPLVSATSRSNVYESTTNEHHIEQSTCRRETTPASAFRPHVAGRGSCLGRLTSTESVEARCDGCCQNTN